MHESAPEKVPNMQLHTLHMANRCMSSWRMPASSSNVPANKGGTSGSCLYSATDGGYVVRTLLAGSWASAWAAFIAVRNAASLKPT